MSIFIQCYCLKCGRMQYSYDRKYCPVCGEKFYVPTWGEMFLHFNPFSDSTKYIEKKRGKPIEKQYLQMRKKYREDMWKKEQDEWNAEYEKRKAQRKKEEQQAKIDAENKERIFRAAMHQGASFDAACEAASKGTYNIPKCPTCGSANVERISTGKKVVGAAAFGVLSSDVRNTMHCKNCGMKW